MQAGACRCEFFLGWGPEWARWELPSTLLPLRYGPATGEGSWSSVSVAVTLVAPRAFLPPTLDLAHSRCDQPGGA